MTEKRSNYLIDEPALQVLPSLAVAIGMSEAIVLQQVHYWLIANMRRGKDDSHYRAGRWWCYNTYQQWQVNNFPWWTTRTIRRLFDDLKGCGLLIIEKPDNRNEGLWVTIDYPVLEDRIEAGVTNSADLGGVGADILSGPLGQNVLTSREHRDYPDIKDTLPIGNADLKDPTPLPELAIVTPKPKKSWPLLDVVKANWQFPPAANGMATHIATMLAGRSTTGKWAIGNLETPAEPEEVIRFVKWYRCRRPGKNLPLTPETLQLEFETFRDEKNREKNKTYFAEPGREPHLLPIAQRKEGTFRDFRQALIDHGMWRNCGQGVVFYTSAWRGDKLVYIIGDDYNGLDTRVYETLANGSPDFTTEMTWEQFNEHYR